MNNILAKIKARLPGGVHFNQLCSVVFVDLFHGKFTLRDKYVFQSYFMGRCYADNYLINVSEQNYSQNDYLIFKELKYLNLLLSQKKQVL